MAKQKNKLVGLVMVIVGVLYLLNFTFGVVEFIPDNIPIYGNIDEGIAGGLIYNGLRILFNF